jgi:hypothetical protein
MAFVEGGSSVKASEMNYFDGRKQEQLGHTLSLIVMDTNSALAFATAWSLIVCASAMAQRSFTNRSPLINIIAK